MSFGMFSKSRVALCDMGKKSRVALCDMGKATLNAALQDGGTAYLTLNE